MKNFKKIVLLLSVSVVFCLTATSCLPLLATVGSIIFNFSDKLSENRIIVYGNENNLAVTFQSGKMLATWDRNAAYSYLLTVDKNGEKKEIESDTGSVDLTDCGYSYSDTLSLDLSKTKNQTTTHYSYEYAPLSDEQYSAYATKVSAGFDEIDRYIATRAEWFDFFSYLIVFRDGAEETKDEDGSTAYLLETDCYFAYDYTAFDAYAGLGAEECIENEVYSAIDAYEDSASYAYSYSLDQDKKTVKLYLKFYYENRPTLETDTYKNYENASRSFSERAHYRLDKKNTRSFPIDTVTKTIPVESSDQLYFALKKGYRPLPTEGSPAEAIYGKMRSILSYINTDNSSTYDKLHYIYDYIVDTVIYDYSFTQNTMNEKDSTNSLFCYKCLYLEGVFGYQEDGSFNNNRRVAICDGLSKAYMCMATIEGIPCLKVSGKVNGEGHAWNKAMLNGSWYMVDTTWGNELSRNGSTEYISHDYLLVKDDSKHEENPYMSYPSAPVSYKDTVSKFTHGTFA
ncbi:MAG: hypothetical protein J5781_01195 [Clostridia bacterium]|nr:hypothetical protein [Clostridia bacterium]